MKLTSVFLTLTALAVAASDVAAQDLHSRWDEITASEWAAAVKKSNGTCILPIGILEKHGPAGPIGTDLFDARYAVLNADSVANALGVGRVSGWRGREIVVSDSGLGTAIHNN